MISKLTYVEDVCASGRETKDNLHLHFNTKHGANFAKVRLQEKQQMEQELKVLKLMS